MWIKKITVKYVTKPFQCANYPLCNGQWGLIESEIPIQKWKLLFSNGVFYVTWQLNKLLSDSWYRLAEVFSQFDLIVQRQLYKT